MPYDLDDATDHLAASDPAMASLIEFVGPCRLVIGHMDSPFQALLRAIVYQQLSGKAAGTIHRRLLDRFPGEHPDPEELLATPPEELRAAGLSRAKAAAAHDLAARTLDGTVPDFGTLEAMADAEIVQRLTAVRGVGPWTAEMLLIFQLGRPDVLPLADLGVRKGAARLYGLSDLPTPKELAAAGETWRPYRSVASWYLWRAADADEWFTPAPRKKIPHPRLRLAAQPQSTSSNGRLSN